MANKTRRSSYMTLADRDIKIIPLGGLEAIGMNITVIEYMDSMIVVDCGSSFPTEEMPGIDLVVPDVSYLVQNADKMKGFFITHGHEDHIGALPYVLKRINAPIYATRLTMAIIEDKLSSHDLLESVKRNVVTSGEVIHAGDITVEYIRANHSIADSCMLAISTPEGTILHTGDFKVDYTPIFGEPTDLQRLGELGKKGVLALLSDSTNALRPGFTPSERMVADTFNKTLADYKDSRIMVATFASNVARVQQLVNSAINAGRKVLIEGRSMVSVVEIAKDLGYLRIPDDVLIDVDMLDNYPDNQTLIIMTGSQGEAMAALSRVAAGKHPKIQIKSSDVIIFSSSPIPGNEKDINKVINDITRKGARIINKETHVSGHACQEELKLIYTLTRPKYAIPLHGEFRHREANAEIAQELGIPKKNIFLPDSGDVISVSENEAGITGGVDHGTMLVDGLGVGDVGSIVLRDRQTLAKDGIIVVAMTLSSAAKELLAGPDIVSRGFVYVRESEDLMEEAKAVAKDAVERVLNSEHVDWNRIKMEVRDQMSGYFWKQMKRNPVILPVIMEV